MSEITVSTNFFTNEGGNTLFEKLQNIFERGFPIEYFDILVGYFRSSGYFAVRPFLENIPHIRILVGIDADALAAQYHERGLLFVADGEDAVNQAIEKMKADIASCRYSQEVEQGILQFIGDIASKKLEIRVHRSRKLHAKIYIFRPEGWCEERTGDVITGSSNLTDSGIGSKPASNYEFNVLLHGYNNVQFAVNEFEKLWKEAVPMTAEDAKVLETETHLNETVSPYELYLKMLITYFGRDIEYNPNSVDLPRNYKKLTYQVDAVNQGFEKLRKYNGFFLADVVGLGKTVVALMIAKKFFLSNGYPDHHSRILIIAPPALQSAWKKAVCDFEMGGSIDVITGGKLRQKRDEFQQYDLVIVDEAHKFRNSSTQSYEVLQRLCKTDAPLDSVLGNNPRRKKVILISATPLNNRPEDIKNLVYLFQDGEKTDLDLPNLENFFRSIIKRFKKNTEEPDLDARRRETASLYTDLRENVILPLTVRRTRADLTDNTSYSEDLQAQGIIFPKTKPPVKLLYKLDAELDALFDRTLDALANLLSYSRYRAIGYLKPDKKKKYESADTSANQLPGLIRALLAKRLDSSFYAFKKSLKRFRDNNAAMLKMLDLGTVFILPRVDVGEYILNDQIDELLAKYEKIKDVDPEVEIYSADDFEPDFRETLEEDQVVLDELCTAWEAVGEENDPKYAEFVRVLREEIFDKNQNPSGKVVVFSESEDTTDNIAKRLKEDGIGPVLVVNSSNRDDLEETILQNFDANQKKEDQKSRYNIIISTEVLAEGVNLHRAGVIVNYDTPWNSTRLMQRVGRINRIGSPNESISIYNFFPTSEVNDQIDLENRAMMKLVAFHHALGSDSQIYSPEDETPNSFGMFDNALTDERDERVQVLLKLREFKDKHPERYEKIRKLPMKVRCARKETEISAEELPAVSTVAYLKNRTRDLFYAVSQQNDGGTPKVISFSEAERLLRCDEHTKRTAIPDSHYTQIDLISKAFEEKRNEDAGARETLLIPTENQAVSFIKACIRYTAADSDKALFRAGIETIKQHRYSDLAAHINKIKKSNLALDEKIRKLRNCLEKYGVGAADSGESGRGRDLFNMDTEEPDIIISETFIP